MDQQRDSLNSLSETLDQPPDEDIPSQATGPTTTATTCSDQSKSLSRNSSFSLLNAQAPEFVPRSPSSSSSSSSLASTMTQPRLAIPQPQLPGLVHAYASPNSPFHAQIQSHAVPVTIQNHHPYAHHVPVQYHQPHHHHHHHRQYFGGGGNGGFVDQQEVAVVQVQASQAASVDSDQVAASRNGLSEEANQKILNQVEYYFSDVNLATTEHLMRFINKDPEGYVPISVVASFKKIKALISGNSQLASILRNSVKLAVSDDGKKVRRQHPLTDSAMEDLQSRIVVAENLPEDHCHQSLMKIFASIGSVKTIRTCQPQASNGGASSASRTAKADGMFFSNKLHAFVEYESVELAEKAVTELNDEGNWRNGLRVRLLLRCTTKSAQARVKKVGSEGEATNKEYDSSTLEQQQPRERHLEDPSHQLEARLNEHAGEEHANDKEGVHKKGRNRGRGKGRGQPQYHHHHHGSHVGAPPSNNFVNTEQPTTAKQPPGPRMPDGTRGFPMGRGKPIAINIA